MITYYWLQIEWNQELLFEGSLSDITVEVYSALYLLDY